MRLFLTVGYSLTVDSVQLHEKFLKLAAVLWLAASWCQQILAAASWRVPLAAASWQTFCCVRARGQHEAGGMERALLR